MEEEIKNNCVNCTHYSCYTKNAKSLKSIFQVMIEEIYIKAIELSRKNQQTIGEKNDYFITLAQLERLIQTNCRIL